MKMLNWLKDKALWILGGIAVFLGVIFAVKYERSKILAMKNKAMAKWKLSEANVLDKEAARLAGVDSGLVAKEEMVDETVVSIDKKLQEVKSNVDARDVREVAERFNAMYSGGTGSE